MKNNRQQKQEKFIKSIFDDERRKAYNQGHAQGYADALAKAEEAIRAEKLNEDLCEAQFNYGLDAAISAIRALAKPTV